MDTTPVQRRSIKNGGICMRIETPNDRDQNRRRKAAILLERQEAAEKARKEDVLGNPEAWEAAYERALAKRNQVLQARAVIIPAAVTQQAAEPSAEAQKVNKKISRELARFLNGMSIGAICAAIIIFAMMISAGIV
jgi:hypothetical protein